MNNFVFFFFGENLFIYSVHLDKHIHCDECNLATKPETDPARVSEMYDMVFCEFLNNITRAHAHFVSSNTAGNEQPVCRTIVRNWQEKSTLKRQQRSKKNVLRTNEKEPFSEIDTLTTASHTLSSSIENFWMKFQYATLKCRRRRRCSFIPFSVSSKKFLVWILRWLKMNAGKMCGSSVFCVDEWRAC